MPRLLISRDQIRAGTVQFNGDTARHLAGPLRARVGERIVVVDDAGEAHGLILEAVQRDRVIGAVEWSRAAAGEPSLHVEVVHALVREFDEVVAGLSQMGAAVIRPAITRRAVSRPDPARAETRLRRWRSIAREAAQLAHRAAIPEVAAVTDLSAAVADVADRPRLLACVLEASTPLARLDLDARRPLTIVIGPEGGLDPTEIEALTRCGAETVHLGPRVLPARNAGMVAMSLTLAASGDLDTAVSAPG